jgi:hypothetical protein
MSAPPANQKEIERALRLVENQRRASKAYYERHKEDIKRKSTEYWKTHKQIINERRRLRYALARAPAGQNTTT